MAFFADILTPLLWQGLLISLGINMLFFCMALIKQSDHFTDITYSLTYIALTLIYVLMHPPLGSRDLVAAILVVVWAVRLGSYLLMRIFWMGKDYRFDRMRGKPLRFLSFWILQALTVWIVLFPLYAMVVGPQTEYFDLISLAAVLIWAMGLGIETVADMQKFTFKAKNPTGLWPDTGLWHLSRHPNFFGEMLVWWGFFLYVLPPVWPLRFLALLGPLFISFMLRFVSGVPLLEKSAAKKYGHFPEYQEYLSRTRLLIPLPRFGRRRQKP